jgi:hypothetical protein
MSSPQRLLPNRHHHHLLSDAAGKVGGQRGSLMTTPRPGLRRLLAGPAGRHGQSLHLYGSRLFTGLAAQDHGNPENAPQLLLSSHHRHYLLLDATGKVGGQRGGLMTTPRPGLRRLLAGLTGRECGCRGQSLVTPLCHLHGVGHLFTGLAAQGHGDPENAPRLLLSSHHLRQRRQRRHHQFLPPAAPNTASS